MRLLYFIIISSCVINIVFGAPTGYLFGALALAFFIGYHIYRLVNEDPAEIDRKWKEYRKREKNKPGCYGWVEK